jgi:hypothetical protein
MASQDEEHPSNSSDDDEAFWKNKGVQYKQLVLATAHFIVFIDTDLILDWMTTREYDEAGPKNLRLHNSILNDAALLESTPCDGLGHDIKLHFKRLLGEAVARSLEHDYASAKTMLGAAGRYIRDRGEETSRYWYLLASSLMTAPFILAGCIIWLNRERFSNWFGVTGMWLSLACVAGATGALLSVIGRSGKLKFDCSAGRRLHNLEGASRIWAGAMSGLLVALAVRYGIILAPLGQPGDKIGIMIIAGFAAGAGERLATSIISKFDSTRTVALTESSSKETGEESSSDG